MSQAPCGVFSPVLTAVDATGKPSTRRLIQHCRWLQNQGVGLAVFGTNSEANSFSVAEKQALLTALLDAGIAPAALLPGTGACALPDAIALTRTAVQAGCAGVLTLPPFYYKGVSDEGLFRYYAGLIEGVADARLRVYLYHIPQVSQVPIHLDLIERLLDHYPDAVAGIKDSSGDWNNTAAMIERFGARGFGVFAGSETFLLRIMQAGGVGCISATANVNPAAIVDLYRHWRAPDAQARQERLNGIRKMFERYPMIAAMKAAVAHYSGDAGWCHLRAPLVELADADARELCAALDAAHFAMPDATMLAL